MKPSWLCGGRPRGHPRLRYRLNAVVWVHSSTCRQLDPRGASFTRLRTARLAAIVDARMAVPGDGVLARRLSDSEEVSFAGAASTRGAQGKGTAHHPQKGTALTGTALDPFWP